MVVVAPAAGEAEEASAFVRTTSRDAAAGDVTTCRRSPETEEMVPSLAAMSAVSALYRTMSSWVPPPLVATPLVKVMVVGVPNATGLPVLLETVGLVTGSEEALAPEKARAWSPM